MKIVQLNLVIFLMTLTVSAVAQYDYDNQGVIYSNNGNVGIGTNDPSSLFHLNGWGELLRLTSQDNSIGMTTSLSTTPNGNSNNETVNRILFQALPDNTTSTNRVFHFRGHHGGIFTPLFEIESTHDGNIMRLSSNTNSTSRKLVEVDNQDGSVFVIKGDGKVGIGKLPGSSSAFLDVQGTINSDIGYNINGSRILTVQGNNTFVGFNAGNQIDSGSYNVFVGNYTGEMTSQGSFNTFIGRSSGRNNSNGSRNTFLGFASGHSNDTGNSNLFFGFQSGYSNTVGNDNLFLGNQSGFSNLDGISNTFIGNGTGNENTSGNYNTFIGNQAGKLNTTGESNVFIGYSSGSKNEIGNDNLFLGRSTGNSNTTGNRNVFLGFISGQYNSSGNNNTYVGYGSGRNNIEGDHNIFLGHGAGYNETGSNKLYIENSDSTTPLIYGEFDQDKVGINTTNLVGDYSLFVKDGIITEKVVVEVEGEWPDYVFNPTYQLPSLAEISNYIQQHKHLPEVPSAAEIAAEGLNLGEMEALMMKKIEELTLYAIKQERKVEEVRNEKDVEIEKLEGRNEKLEARMGQMGREKDAEISDLKMRLERLEEIITIQTQER